MSTGLLTFTDKCRWPVYRITYRNYSLLADFSIFAHVSRKLTDRLKTIRLVEESLSVQRYPNLSNWYRPPAFDLPDKARPDMTLNLPMILN